MNLRASGTTLSLLGGFALRRDGYRQSVSQPLQRVHALLALKGRPLHRSEVAGTLWPDLTEARASANLRQVIWRASGQTAVRVDGSELALEEGVVVDVDGIVAHAQRLLAGRPEDVADQDLEPWRLRGELLPNISDLWVIPYRENIREMQTNALETLCRIALNRERVPLAIEAARYAVETDPLRESSRRCLVEAQMAHGNLAEASRLYQEYVRVLVLEAGLEPSPRFAELVNRLWSGPRRQLA